MSAPRPLSTEELRALLSLVEIALKGVERADVLALTGLGGLHCQLTTMLETSEPLADILGRGCS